jgi:peptide/nickel transport system substrate-binding protein
MSGRKGNMGSDLNLAAEFNRRQFLTRCAAVGIVGAASPWLAPTLAHGAEPKSGGVARFGLAGAATGDSLDPGTFIDYYMYAASWAIRNNLTEIAPSNDVIPELAESWDASADLKTWVFRLRQGVEFHNGKSLTSDDVVASLNHHLAKDSKSSGKAILSSVNEISADGKYAVVFHLKTANADLPDILADTRLPIMPADPGGRADVLGNGTGGYILQTFEPGVRMSVKRNPNYWKAGRAHFDAVEILAINDATARSSALRSGSIDVMHRAETKTASLLANTPGLRVIELPSRRFFSAAMIVNQPPFDNADLRLAVKFAVDRQALVNATLNGHGVAGNDQPIGPGYKYFAADIPQRNYDPDKAKFYLKKAGHESLQVTLHTSPIVFDGAIDAAALMKEQARAAGIDIALQQDPADGYWANVWKKVPFCLSWYSGRPTEGQQFSYAYTSGANSNESFWHSDQFDHLLAEALGTIDESRRRALYHELEMIVRDDGGSCIFAFANILDACSDKIRTPDKISSLFELDGSRAIERWWFA